MHSKDACSARRADGTTSLALFVAACINMGSKRLPLVRYHSQARATEKAVTCGTNKTKD
jgi:hypothetical protein